jgi:hypothetical protein
MMIQTLVVVAAGVWQLQHLKSFFVKHKLV